MRITPFADELNLKVIPATPRAADGKVLRLYDLFTTRDGSWEPSAHNYSIPQWARDTYLKPWGHADYFDDAGADHHVLGGVYDPTTKSMDKNIVMHYWTWADDGNHTDQPVKTKSGWANIIMFGKYFPDQGHTGPYAWQPKSAVPADIVQGAGMPYNLHVSFFATWVLTTETQVPVPDPTEDARILKLETWAKAISAKYPGGPQYA